jgi:hypothetical protein
MFIIFLYKITRVWVTVGARATIFEVALDFLGFFKFYTFYVLFMQFLLILNFNFRILEALDF